MNVWGTFIVCSQLFICEGMSISCAKASFKKLNYSTLEPLNDPRARTYLMNYKREKYKAMKRLV